MMKDRELIATVLLDLYMFIDRRVRKEFMAMHDFLLVDNLKIDNKDKVNSLIHDYFQGEYYNIYNYVEIHDDVIVYFMDTLNFIKFKWVSGEIHNGIDYYGYSIISGSELHKAKVIFESWKNIFEQGQSEIILTGGYAWNEDEKRGEYEKIKFNKKEIIVKLNSVIHMCNIAYMEEKSILHLGI